MPQETTLHFAPRDGIRLPFQKLFFPDGTSEEAMRKFVDRLHPLLAPVTRLSLTRKVAVNPHAQAAPGTGWRLELKLRCEDNTILTLRIDHFQSGSDIVALVQTLTGRLCNDKGSPVVAMVASTMRRVTYV